jgi:hypothetical protein
VTLAVVVGDVSQVDRRGAGQLVHPFDRARQRPGRGGPTLLPVAGSGSATARSQSEREELSAGLGRGPSPPPIAKTGPASVPSAEPAPVGEFGNAVEKVGEVRAEVPECLGLPVGEVI